MHVMTKGKMKLGRETLTNQKHFTSLSKTFSDAFVTGKFCDVKVVCQDSNLWAHRVVLSTVSPFLRNLLVEFERRGDDVITIFLPLIKGYHMKLVLDYIYSGAMYLCGAHLQYVIQVMEVLQLKCGVSVNKMVRNQGSATDLDWIEVEHSTVKIKSNIPPCLPPVDPQTQAKPVPEKCKQNKHEPDHVDKHKTKEGIECVDLNESVDENDSVESSSTAKPEKSTDSAKPKEPSEPANHDTVDDSEVNDEEGVTEVTEVTGGSEDEDEDEEYVKDTKETPNLEPISEEPVVVEVDEEFAVDSLTSSEAGSNNGKKHKCALCGRLFRFYENLRIHLTGHLGVKVSLSRCHTCRRNFKNQNELTLHLKSHSYARHLGKYRLAKSAAETARTEAKIITTAGTKDKKIVRKYTKNRQNMLTRPDKQQQGETSGVLEAEDPATEVLEDESDSTPRPRGRSQRVEKICCEICSKKFDSRYFYLSHMETKHRSTKEDNVVKQGRKKSSASESTFSNDKSPGSVSSEKRGGVLKPVLSKGDGTGSPGVSSNPYSRQYSTPNRKRDTSDSDMSPAPVSKKRRESLPGIKPAHSTPERVTAKSLQCPDCDRVFVASSILERHLFTAKHGVYSMYSSDSGPGSPHVHARAPPPIPHVPNRQVDCHLCGQKFMRVKDLAKHREKVCTAWINTGQ